MKKFLLLVGAAAALAVSAVPAEARDRYAERPPVVVSPDLSAPWVMQLGRKPGTAAAARAQAVSAYQMQPRPTHSPAAAGPTHVQTAAVRPMYTKREMQRQHRPEIPAAAGRL